MTGFTAKRVSETKLAKEVQTSVLQMWVENKSHPEISKFLYNKYNSVLNGRIDKKDIIKRSRLRPNRFTVKCPDCRVKYHLRDCVKLEHGM